MGRGNPLGLRGCEEVDEEKATLQLHSEIRGVQRRLTCVALFVAFLVFTVTYLLFIDSDVFWGKESFFETPADFRGSPLKLAPQSEDFPNPPLPAPVHGTHGASSGPSFEGAPAPAGSNSSANNRTLSKESFGASDAEAEGPAPAAEEPTPASAAPKPTSELRTSQEPCDVKEGQWIPDARLPLYNSSTCKYIQRFQNCEKNGRTDMRYLYWKWKPNGCEVPRVQADAFLGAMRNRTLVFAGDSIARNQFQSLLCTLSQVEDPKDMYHSEDNTNHIYLFQSFNLTLRIHWAPYLVHFEDKSTTWPNNTTDIVTHVYLDELDEVWTKATVGADILQISTGQWWYKKAIYLEKRKPIGCHACPSCFKEIGFAEPYGVAMANILMGSLSISGFSGTIVYRSFAPDHFEGGEWDTGGACPRMVPGGVPISFLAEWMYNIQMKQFKNVTEELDMVATKRLKMLDITNMAQIRGDGHPNGYRDRIEKQDRIEGSRKDCLHWCLPGPIDAWNDLLVEILRDVIFN